MVVVVPLAVLNKLALAEEVLAPVVEFLPVKLVVLVVADPVVHLLAKPLVEELPVNQPPAAEYLPAKPAAPVALAVVHLAKHLAAAAAQPATRVALEAPRLAGQLPAEEHPATRPLPAEALPGILARLAALVGEPAPVAAPLVEKRLAIRLAIRPRPAGALPDILVHQVPPVEERLAIRPRPAEALQDILVHLVALAEEHPVIHPRLLPAAAPQAMLAVLEPEPEKPAAALASHTAAHRIHPQPPVAQPPAAAAAAAAQALIPLPRPSTSNNPRLAVPAQEPAAAVSLVVVVVE